MKIKDYGQFLNENINDNDDDLVNVLELLQDVETEDILELRDSLEELSMESESLNENIITDFIDNLKIKFRKILDDRIWIYLINRKRNFYLNLARKLDMFDLTSLDDVFKNYPGFKVESLYLAGGMDKAVDVGAGWRLIAENEFEKYPGKGTGLPEIDMGEFGTAEPKRVVDGIYLDMFLKNPSKTKRLYNLPLVLNPVRKEIDRTKDKAFHAGTIMYKTFTNQTPPEELDPTFKDLRTTMSRSIEADDEHLVRIADFVFLGLNQAAAAGTYGELQMGSFLNKPIFVWMTGKKWKLGQTKKDPYGGFSFWTLPHICKYARNHEEMQVLVNTIINYAR